MSLTVLSNPVKITGFQPAVDVGDDRTAHHHVAGRKIRQMYAGQGIDAARLKGRAAQYAAGGETVLIHMHSSALSCRPHFHDVYEPGE